MLNGGINRYLYNGKEVHTAQLDKRYKKTTSAEGEKIGKRSFELSRDKGGSERILFDPSKEEGLIKVGNWEEVIAGRKKKANSQDLTVTIEQFKLNGQIFI